MHFYRVLTRSRVALLGLALAIAVGCATKNIQQAPTGRFQLKPGAFNQFSPQQDIQLGQQAAAEVNRTMPVLADSSPVTQYIQQLGKSLAAHAPGEVKWPFSFHAVNQKEINAFALPGGARVREPRHDSGCRRRGRNGWRSRPRDLTRDSPPLDRAGQQGPNCAASIGSARGGDP